MSDDALKETLLSRKTVFSGHLLHLESWEVALPDGRKAGREVILLGGASAAAALDDQGRIPLVRQHRIACGRFTWELPAGKLDSPDEAPLDCAKRELLEETGLTAEQWQPLTVIEPAPAYSSERLHLFLARTLHRGPAATDDGEFLECAFFPLETAFRMCMDGTIRDSKTVIGILMTHALLFPAP